MEKEPLRYPVMEVDVSGMWVDGRDSVEMVLRLPSASRPGTLNATRFVLPKSMALELARALTLAANDEHEPPAGGTPSR